LKGGHPSFLPFKFGLIYFSSLRAEDSNMETIGIEVNLRNLKFEIILISNKAAMDRNIETFSYNIKICSRHPTLTSRILEHKNKSVISNSNI
jgi:hypothetical protein